MDGQVRAGHGKTPRSQDSGNSWDVEGEELVSERRSLCLRGAALLGQLSAIADQAFRSRALGGREAS